MCVYVVVVVCGCWLFALLTVDVCFLACVVVVVVFCSLALFLVEFCLLVLLFVDVVSCC